MELNTDTGSTWASLTARLVSHPPAVQETQVRFLGGEDPLEKRTATHSSILAWRLHGQRSLAGYGLWGRKSRTDSATAAPQAAQG